MQYRNVSCIPLTLKYCIERPFFFLFSFFFFLSFFSLFFSTEMIYYVDRGRPKWQAVQGISVKIAETNPSGDEGNKGNSVP